MVLSFFFFKNGLRGRGGEKQAKKKVDGKNRDAPAALSQK